MYSLVAKILDVDQPTVNGNIYPHGVIERAIEKVNDRELLGGFANESMDSEETRDFFSMSIQDVSHRVSNLRLVDGKLMGDVIVLDTPKGMLLQELINTKAEVSYGVCGAGDVSQPDENGIKTITNFSIAYINVVPKN